MLTQEQFKALVADDQKILNRRRDKVSGPAADAVQRSLNVLVGVQSRALEDDPRTRAERR